MQDPLEYFLSLQDQKHPFCLVSGGQGKAYVGVNPSKIWKIYPHHLESSGQVIPLRAGENPFKLLEEDFKPRSQESRNFFHSGWLGFWAYEMAPFADSSLPRRNLPDNFLLGWWAYYEGVKMWESDRCKGERPFAPTTIHSHVLHENNKSSYLSSLSKILSYIEAGDCYQVNFSQAFEMQCPSTFSPPEEFVKLVQKHPAPFSAYLDCGEKKIISLSPEEFLNISGDRIRTSPIKGTRRRSVVLSEDEIIKAELVHSEKEKAELLMIVDLERNDLGKVCESGSVKVTELRKIESFDYVHHALSVLEGRKRKEVSPLEATKSMFPGGSITGAPKKRAMEIIQELESHPRGIYTGALGFYDQTGLTNLNIAIRTLEIEAGKIKFCMGGGIVADSDPQKEYEELFVKAKVFDVFHHLSK